MQRQRLLYLLAALVVIALGMFLRSGLCPVLPILKKYGADALWALMVFLLSAIARPRWPSWHLAMATFGLACAIEFSQLYHAPWIDVVRATRVGALIFGSVFNWPDMAAYALGVGTGLLLDSSASGAKYPSEVKVRSQPRTSI